MTINPDGNGQFVMQMTPGHLPGHTSDDPEMRRLAARDRLRRQLFGLVEDILMKMEHGMFSEKEMAEIATRNGGKIFTALYLYQKDIT